MMEPAATVIRLCGGVRRTAHLAGRNRAQVYRWTYPRERGGTGGIVPADAAHKLLEAAQADGVALKPEHFFAASEAAE